MRYIKTLFLIVTIFLSNIIYAQLGTFRIKAKKLYTFTYNEDGVSDLKNETFVDFPIVIKDDVINFYNPIEEEFIVYKKLEQSIDGISINTQVEAIDKKGRKCTMLIVMGEYGDEDSGVSVYYYEEGWGVIYYGVLLK